MTSTSATQHRVLIVGAGTAGLTVAARLRRAGVSDIAVLDPSPIHYYQPLWTLVGGGQADIRSTGRAQESVLPEGVTWLRDAAAGFDPDAGTVLGAGGDVHHYEQLVVAPGLQLRFEDVPGLQPALATAPVSSNYRADLAPRTWELIRNFRSGTAVFTQPAGPIKCAGAPQKIAYLAADYWRRQGLLGQIRIVLVIPDPAMFKVPVWSSVLEKVAARYGIEVRLSSEMVSVDADSRELVIADKAAGTKETLHFDLLHAVPPQAAPDVVRDSPLADPASPFGYVEADKHTLVHPRYPNVYSVGDAANLPTSKTGAAVRKEAAVVAANLVSAMAGRPAEARYDGYTSCPLVTARDKMLLAEFDYDLQPAPTLPLIDTTKERRDMWVLKRYGLPALYWHGMLKGRA